MPIALVQSATQVTVDNSAALTFDLTLTGTVSGNALVVHFAVYNANLTWTVTSVADGGNTWTTRVATATTATERRAAVTAWATNITGGTRTITLTIAGTTGNSYLTYGGQEWSGVATSAAEDTWDGNGDVDITTNDVTAGPITTTDQNDLLIGCAAIAGNDSTQNWASPTSWTNSYRENNNNAHCGIDAGYWLPGAIKTTYSAQWAHDNLAGQEGAAVMVALIAAPTIDVVTFDDDTGDSFQIIQGLP